MPSVPLFEPGIPRQLGATNNRGSHLTQVHSFKHHQFSNGHNSNDIALRPIGRRPQHHQRCGLHPCLSTVLHLYHRPHRRPRCNCCSVYRTARALSFTNIIILIVHPPSHIKPTHRPCGNRPHQQISIIVDCAATSSDDQSHPHL